MGEEYSPTVEEKGSFSKGMTHIPKWKVPPFPAGPRLTTIGCALRPIRSESVQILSISRR